jgi:hypothetical protein
MGMALAVDESKSIRLTIGLVGIQSLPLWICVLEVCQSPGRCFFGIPAMLRVAERKYALLGTRLLFITSCTADGGIETVFVESLLECGGFHDVGMHWGAVN